MNPAGKKSVWLAAGAVLCLLVVLVRAGNETARQAGTPPDETIAASPGPAVSPVETFRKLLALSPAERNRLLTNYPPATRDRILGKVEEYQLLPVDFRELRLQATELRWYLLPLLRAPLSERAAKLNSVPEPYQKLVAARLDEWDLWPPSLKDEVLEYETTLHYFVGRNATVQPQMVVEDLPEKDRLRLEQKLAEWQALPLAQREQVYAGFQHYFELSEAEKQKTLDALSEPERQDTQKVLDPIERKPKTEQEQYLAAFRQFSEMSSQEREQFVRNAERWQKMSAAERQAWRDLVKQLADRPPLPLDFFPLHVQPVGPNLPLRIKTNSAAVPAK